MPEFLPEAEREREETKEKLIGINTIRCEGEEEEEPLAVCVSLST